MYQSLKDFLGAVVAATKAGSLVHPDIVDTIGVKNITYYRTKFFRIAQDADLSAEDMKLVFQLTMSVKNQKRIVEGVKVTFDQERKDMLKGAMSFIESKCCNSTSSQGEKLMPTVKIADSFPDIVSILFVHACVIREIKDPAEITNLLIAKMWFASVHMDSATQAINKASVRTIWDSWGTSATNGKKNSLGNTIKFEEQIYQNSANDKISLLNMDGTVYEAPNEGHSKETIQKWVATVIESIANLEVTVVSTESSSKKKLS